VYHTVQYFAFPILDKRILWRLLFFWPLATSLYGAVSQGVTSQRCWQIEKGNHFVHST
jgi:hypothetical protein